MVLEEVEKLLCYHYHYPGFLLSPVTIGLNCLMSYEPFANFEINRQTHGNEDTRLRSTCKFGETSTFPKFNLILFVLRNGHSIIFFKGSSILFLVCRDRFAGRHIQTTFTCHASN